MTTELSTGESTALAEGMDPSPGDPRPIDPDPDGLLLLAADLPDDRPSARAVDLEGYLAAVKVLGSAFLFLGLEM